MGLRNYLHFRYPENDRSKQALVKPGVVRHGDFLDNLEDDAPKGCWGVHYDPTAKYSIVRSFYWPGSYFCHERCVCVCVCVGVSMVVVVFVVWISLLDGE